jgi:hypothetical protein
MRPPGSAKWFRNGSVFLWISRTCRLARDAAGLRRSTVTQVPKRVGSGAMLAVCTYPHEKYVSAPGFHSALLRILHNANMSGPNRSVTTTSKPAHSQTRRRAPRLSTW